MRKIKATLCILLALAMAFALFACNKTETSGGGNSASPSGGTSPDSSTSAGGSADDYVALTIGVDSYLGRFLAGLTPAESWTGCDAVFDTIFRTDPYTKDIISYVLKDWGWEDDYTFVMHMRDDVFFSNGDNATAEDIIFSYLSHDERGSNYLNSFGLIFDECIARDTYTAQFKFEAPYPAFVRSSFYLLDKKWSLEQGWDSMEWYKPVASGPYYVDEWVADSYMVLKSRGDDYWYKDEGPIYVDEYTIKYYPDGGTLYMALEIGDVDLAANIQSTDYGRFLNTGGDGFDVELRPAGGILYFCFSFIDTDIWFNDNLREAVALGVKWDEVGQLAMGDVYIPTYSVGPSNSADYVKTSDLPGMYEYNPERAKELLAQEGYGPDNPLKISTVTMENPMLRNAFEAFDFYATQIGIDCTVEFGDTNAALSVWLNNEGTDFGFWWAVGGNPYGEVRQAMNEAADPGGVSFDYVAFPEFLEIFNRMAYSLDADVRSQASKEVQQYMYDNIVYIPTSETASIFGWRTDSLNANQISRYVYSGNNVQIGRLGLEAAWK